MRTVNWKATLIRLFLLAWGVQVLWLGWHFSSEAQDLARRLFQGNTGDTVRQEDPFYRWLMTLSKVMPPQAAYVFLDRYEAGKEIEARYHLYPRRHLLGSPDIPPSYLFYYLRQIGGSFLIVNNAKPPFGPGVQAALASQAFTRLELPGPGPVFRVDPVRLHGDFYD